MVSHAEFLRDHWEDDDATAKTVAITRAMVEAGRRAAEGPMAEGLAALDESVERLEGAGMLAPGDAPLLRWVGRLTLAPGGCTRSDLQQVREAGLSDRELHDVVHVAANFAYMNRLADGLGVTLLEHKHAFAVELLGEEALAEHLAWGAPAL
jgi:hypothetical protein